MNLILERVRLSFDAATGIAELALARPQRLNALDATSFDALLQAAQELQALRGLRAVVMHGEGSAFCAGLDLANFQKMMSGERLDMGQRSGGTHTPILARTFGPANGPQQLVLAWRQLQVPVVAALHGAVLGGGLQLAMGADWRFAAPDTQLAVKEVAWGLVPDMAGFPLLRELVRADVLRELVLTGREVGAQEAQALGLVTRVVADPLAEARNAAQVIARLNPEAIRAAKRLLNLTHAQASDAALLFAESAEQERVIGSHNQVEAVRARIEKREPQFKD